MSFLLSVFLSVFLIFVCLSVQDEFVFDHSLLHLNENYNLNEEKIAYNLMALSYFCR